MIFTVLVHERHLHFTYCRVSENTVSYGMQAAQLSSIAKIFVSRTAYHIYFWLFIFYINADTILRYYSYTVFKSVNGVLNITTYAMPFQNGLPNALLYAGACLVVGIMPVYIHFYCLRTALLKQKIIIYIISLLGIIIVFAFIYNVVISQILSYVISTNFIEDPSRHFDKRLFSQTLTYYRSIWSIGQLIFISTALKFIKDGVKDRLNLQKKKTQQLESELSALKAQINPHFMFNTLNNLYGLALANSAKTPEMLMQLSELMRYILDTANNDVVTLREEIDFLKSYIDLESLRLEKNTISFNIEGEPNGIAISPLLFLPFVENGIKHGLNNTVPENFVTIHMIIGDKKILFTVINSMIPTSPGAANRSGTGLTNITRRLELLYPEKHRLSFGPQDGVFTVKLELGL